MVQGYSPLKSFPPEGLASSLQVAYFSFILACVQFPSSTCRVDLSTSDTCPISCRPESLGVVDKVKEHGSVRCKVLSEKGSKGSISQIFQIFFPDCPYAAFAPFLSGALGQPRAAPSSAVSLGPFVLYAIELEPPPSSAWALRLPVNRWAWPIYCWAPQY